MRASRLYAPTLKENPSDAEVVSHQLLTRAGYMRKLTAGVYDYLPLARRVLRKIEEIVRQELDAAGAQEILMPMVQPAEIWKESGRWQQYGPELLRMRDRKGGEFCLGPTHEEVVVDIVRRDVRSFRDLPINLYQIQAKFRDEIRPRAGLMRGREFIMKDAYSFDATEEGALVSYEQMFEAYCKIFTRCGLDFRPVEADTGAIGGSRSHEFQVLAESGEDAIVSCDSCDYAANVEQAEVRALPTSTLAKTQIVTKTKSKKKLIADKKSREKIDKEFNKHTKGKREKLQRDEQEIIAKELLRRTKSLQSIEKLYAAANERRFKIMAQQFKSAMVKALCSAREELALVETPQAKTIEAVAALLKRSHEDCVKTLIVDADGELVMALVRGDHELNEVALKRLLGAVHVEFADEERVGKAMKAPVGSLGPCNIPEGAISKVVADVALQGRVNLVVGANKKGHHLTGVSLERDCAVEAYATLRMAQEGDPCPRCEGKLRSFKGIEVGHVFYLGTKYSKAMGCTVLDEQGEATPVEMGCYGIGVSRVMAAAIEQHHDKDGICWPVSLAPFQVHILTLQPNVPEVVACAEELYEACLKAGVEVLYDDRDTRAGGKFKDADLMGVPVRVAIGGRGVKEGVVEVKNRREEQPTKVAISEVLADVQARLKALSEGRA